MRKIKDRGKETPSTVEQLAAAMAALGMYAGENTDAEHRAEAACLGGMKAYRMLLANALLGTVEADAMLADSSGVSVKQMDAAHQQALASAGVESSSLTARSHPYRGLLRRAGVVFVADGWMKSFCESPNN